MALPYREVARRLRAAGFAPTGQRGSHVKFVRREGTHSRVVIVPRQRELQTGTIKSVLRQAGLSNEEFGRF